MDSTSAKPGVLCTGFAVHKKVHDDRSPLDQPPGTDRGMQLQLYAFPNRPLSTICVTTYASHILGFIVVDMVKRCFYKLTGQRQDDPEVWQSEPCGLHRSAGGRPLPLYVT